MSDDKYKVVFSKAYLHQHEGELVEAIRLYKEFLDQEPENIEALHFLGLAYAQSGEMELALNYLEQVANLDPNNPSVQNNIGNIYKKQGELEKAANQYRKAILLNSEYAQAHHNLATIAEAQNDFLEALQHYRAAIHAEPDFTIAHFSLGILLLKNNKLDAAEIQFQNVIRLCPEYIQAYFYLGVLSLEKNQLAEAKKFFQETINLNPEYVDALVNLGVIALKEKEGQQAVDYFTRALALDNDHIDARNNLAATFMHHDRFENALMHYDVLVKKDPNNKEYLYNSGVAQMALGHLKEAIKCFETLLQNYPEHFESLNNLAAIYIRLEDKDKAKNLLKKAVTINPSDPTSTHMLHALQGDQTHKSTCPEYAKNLFNNYATYYEQHMEQGLKYGLPNRTEKLLQYFKIAKVDYALDLGCGTGLSGVVLDNYCNYLVGVDIAEKMLNQARDKKIYDELVESDLSSFLTQDKRQYGLIIALDVFPYFGRLDELFKLIVSRMLLKGYLIFTNEISETEDWHLQITARFSHNPNYIKKLCENYGLSLIHQEEVVARQQKGEGLKENLFIFQKLK